MGGYYTNITLSQTDSDKVAAWLGNEGRDAFVSPAENGHVVVFDEVHDRSGGLELGELAARLSERFQCAALAVANCDDDRFEFEPRSC